MTPDRAEAAAVMLESLAADSGNAKLRYETAVAILDVPLTHPLRWIEVERSGSAWWLLKDRTPETPQGEIRMADVILDYAEHVQRGERVKDRLLGWAADIRAGAEEMKRTGWYPTMHGGDR